MAAPFRMIRRVEFRETDMAGIVHFSTYFHYMEEAEHALWRHVGLSVMLRDQEGVISFPRVSAQCDYTGSVRFEEELELLVDIVRLGTKSLTFRTRFFLQGQPIAAGTITSVCCRLCASGPPRPLPIPDWIAGPLAPYCVPAMTSPDNSQP